MHCFDGNLILVKKKTCQVFPSFFLKIPLAIFQTSNTIKIPNFNVSIPRLPSRSNPNTPKRNNFALSRKKKIDSLNCSLVLSKASQTCQRIKQEVNHK